tara:strand:+ start:548 stop:1255 length:708 start_codon:yes stop_codon:yes gene_type:complete
MESSMRKYLHLSMIVMCGIFSNPLLSQDNVLTQTEIQEGWSLMFDGADLSQWRNFKRSDLSSKWQAIEGEMRLNAKDAGDIVSKNAYRDFELQLDWNISSAGNSGIFLRVDEDAQYVYSHALEVQILDNEHHPDSKLSTRRSGSLYDLQASPPSSHKPAEQWNHVRIVFRGMNLNVWQNDVQTVDILVGSADWQDRLANSKFKTWPSFGLNYEGFIGLQDHGDHVAFKNIKIKKL